MTILNKDVLEGYGPYIEFCILDEPINVDDDIRFACPSRSDYQHGIFFEFADGLLETYCSITRSYSPFDPHDFVQFKRPYGIYEFTSKLLMWEYQLAIMPDNYFGMQLEYFSIPTPDHEDYGREQLKIDLIETIHFLISKLHQAVAEGKCVAIVGI